MSADGLRPNHTLRSAITEYRERARRAREAQQRLRSRTAPQEESDANGPPLTASPGQPASLRSIRPEAVALLDQLVEVIQGIDWHPPQIVILGGENQGKSTVMERLLGLPVFPRDRKLCTRVATRVQLRRGPVQAPIIRRRHMEELGRLEAALRQQHGAGPIGSGWQQVPVEDMMQEVQQRMCDILDETNANRGSGNAGVSLDHEIVIRLQNPGYPEMDLVDLPGLVTVNSEDPNMPEHTKQLTSKYMQQHGAHSMFLVVLDANNPMNQATAMQLIEQHQLKDATMGIITKCDLVRAADDDESDSDVINTLLDPANPAFVGLGYGWHLLSSRGLKQKAGRRYLQVLSDVEQQETRLFQRLEEEQTAHGGLRAPHGIAMLCRRICKKYSSYLHEHWAPRVISKLDARVRKLKRDVLALGVPFQDVVVVDTRNSTGERSQRTISIPEHFSPGSDVMDAAALQTTLRTHVLDLITRHCRFADMCETWLLQMLAPVRKSLFQGSGAQPPIAMSFAAARTQTVDRVAALRAALANVHAALGSAAAPGSSHPVAAQLVDTLMHASTRQFQLSRFQHLRDEVAAACNAGLVRWTGACQEAVAAAQQWLERKVAQAGSDQPRNADWFEGSMDLHGPQLATVFNTIVAASVAAFDAQSLQAPVPDTLSVSDSNEEKRRKLHVAMQECHEAKNQLQTIIHS